MAAFDPPVDVVIVNAVTDEPPVANMNVDEEDEDPPIDVSMDPSRLVAIGSFISVVRPPQAGMKQIKPKVSIEMVFMMIISFFFDFEITTALKKRCLSLNPRQM